MVLLASDAAGVDGGQPLRPERPQVVAESRDRRAVGHARAAGLAGHGLAAVHQPAAERGVVAAGKNQQGPTLLIVPLSPARQEAASPG
jgi:hypothetical protein